MTAYQRVTRMAVILILALSFSGFSKIPAKANDEQDTGVEIYQKLVPLHEPKLPPGPNDWMAQHRENDQSFFEYIKSQPAQPDEQRKYIYIMLIGEFDQTRKAIIKSTAKYIEAYYNLPTKWMPPMNLNAIPASARRVHPTWGDHQILTTYVLEKVLKPALPEDAISLIAFTSSDLWPGQGWNFVFGQASIVDRVGVWSIHRNGNPNKNKKEHKLCLLRTIKTGTHELGHMFGMHHCPYYECNMNGSNHRAESDSQPVWLCPVCLRKLTWNIGMDPVARYKKLIEISEEFGFDQEKKFFEMSIKKIEK